MDDTFAENKNFLIIRYLLEKAELSPKEYLHLFEFNNITDDQMFTFSIEDVNNLFEPYGLTPTAKFYHSLIMWKNMSTKSTPARKMSSKTAEGFRKYRHVKNSIDIESIMDHDMIGRKALMYCRKNYKLEESHRSDIINLIVKHLLEQKIEMEKCDFFDLTEEILKVFKTSNPEEAVSIIGTLN